MPIQCPARTIRGTKFAFGTHETNDYFKEFPQQWPDGVLIASRGGMDLLGALRMNKWFPFLEQDRPTHEERLLCLERTGGPAGRRRVIACARIDNPPARTPDQPEARTALLMRNALDLASKAWPDAFRVELDHLIGWCPGDAPWPDWHIGGLVHGVVHHLRHRPQSTLRTICINHSLKASQLEDACDMAADAEVPELETQPDEQLMREGREMALRLPRENEHGWRLLGIGLVRLRQI